MLSIHWPVQSVELVFDVRSGAAKIGKKKKAVYSEHLYKNLRLDIDWRSGGSESIDFTYFDHGANSDAYAGLRRWERSSGNCIPQAKR